MKLTAKKASMLHFYHTQKNPVRNSEACAEAAHCPFKIRLGTIFVLARSVSHSIFLPTFFFSPIFRKISALIEWFGKRKQCLTVCFMYGRGWADTLQPHCLYFSSSANRMAIYSFFFLLFYILSLHRIPICLPFSTEPSHTLLLSHNCSIRATLFHWWVWLFEYLINMYRSLFRHSYLIYIYMFNVNFNYG